MALPDLTRVTGFQWDAGNARKNDKHGVTQEEAEQVFDHRTFVMEDMKHSVEEDRFRALGETSEGRLLQVVFTMRDEGVTIRVISARPMHRAERVLYEAEKTKAHSQIQN